MRTKRIGYALFMMLSLCICTGMAGCKEGENTSNNGCECNNKTNSVEIKSMEGTIDFKEDIQEWYISVHAPGTYDEVKVFFPCNLEESCKKTNEKVQFSGVAFDPLSDSDLSGFTAGCIFFCIEISSIKLLKS